MAASPNDLLHYIRRMVMGPVPEDTTDAALLERFIASRDDRAFGLLVDRYGPLVFQICRRVLGNGADTEEASQAVFLVLARKAAAVGRREALAAWLHGVARRVALKARSKRFHQARQTRPLNAVAVDPRPDPLDEISARELLLIVDEELQRLPDEFRLPIIHCCLEGRSLEETSRVLGWSVGSVKGRLERGRARLHQRLLRRGLSLSAALLVAEVVRGSASALEAARLIPDIKAFVMMAATTTQASVLAAEVIKDLALPRLKIAAALLVTACLLVTGLVILRANSTPVSGSGVVPPNVKENQGSQAPRLDILAVPFRQDPDVSVAVTGHVLDPQGKPVQGARLYVGYSVSRYARGFQVRQPTYSLKATSGSEGRFQLTFKLSELNAKWLDDSRPAVIAVREGYGPDWAEIGLFDKEAEIRLRLVEDVPVEGRILEQNRQPVAGATLKVVDVSADTPEAMTRWLRGEININSWSARSWRGPLPEQPKEVKTDADGRFRMTGLGGNRVVFFALEGPALWSTALAVATRPAEAKPFFNGIAGASFEHTALPSRPIQGVVRDQVTGRPVAGVTVSVPNDSLPVAITDENGRYELLDSTKGKDMIVVAQPASGQPYFTASARVPEGLDFGPVTADLELIGGIPVEGRLTLAPNQKRPSQAVVDYFPLFPNPHSARITSGGRAASSAVVQPDGSYRLMVLPGPGVVGLAASPRSSYAEAVVDEGVLANLCPDVKFSSGGHSLPTASQAGKQGLCCIAKYNALSFINPDEQTASLVVDLALRPGHVLEGSLVGPKGQPQTGVRVVGLSANPEEELLTSPSFAVAGLNPRRGRDLYFYHQEFNLGKIVSLRGDETAPLLVQLEPGGLIRGRLVNPNGQDVSGALMTFHPLKYGPAIKVETDGEGRFHAALLPGQSYSCILAGSRLFLRPLGRIEVVSGRSQDLGNLSVTD